MDRHLLNYLPPVLREVLEFQIINGANAVSYTHLTLPTNSLV